MKKVVKIFCVIISMGLFLPQVVQANDVCVLDEEEIAEEEAILIYDNGNVSYFVSEDSLIKVEVCTSNSTADFLNLDENGEQNKECVSDINFYTADISSQERTELLSSELETRTGNLIKQDQAMTYAGKIRITLIVSYSNTANGLHLCKATGEYTHLAYESGIVAQSSELYYNVAGSIYSNGVFQRKGNYGNTSNLAASFSNVTLMPENISVQDYTAAGVNYTLYCSRGVSATVYMSW